MFENLVMFGLIYGKFRGLLPVIQAHQKVLCFAAKVATLTLLAMHAVDQW